MPLLASELELHIQHTLGGNPDTSKVTTLEIINSAGDYMSGMHKWKFWERPPIEVDLRGRITVTGASWTVATKTLTKTGAFASYTFLQGDSIEITGGTSTTLGQYFVASRTDSNSIVLEASISSSNQTDIAGTMDLPAVALPSDFHELIAYHANNSSIRRGLWPTSAQGLMDMRANEVLLDDAGDGWGYSFYITHDAPSALPTVVGGAPVPRMELWPTPSVNEKGAFTLMYRSSWRRIVSTAEEVDVKPYCYPLLKQLVRTFARGWEEEDGAPLESRLALIEEGHMYRNAKRVDGSVQPSYGQLANGAVSTLNRRIVWTLSTMVAEPGA